MDELPGIAVLQLPSGWVPTGIATFHEHEPFRHAGERADAWACCHASTVYKNHDRVELPDTTMNDQTQARSACCLGPYRLVGSV